MITFLDLLREDKKITILLGAGASRSAGFPTDTELRDQIIDVLKNKVRFFENGNYTAANCSELRTKLIRGGYETIDELINSEPEYAPLGKLAILRCLLDYERSSDPDSLFYNSHWYMPFFSSIFKANLVDKLVNLGFITLNYDRTLVYFLNDFSKNRNFEYSPKILHLHGRLPFMNFETTITSETLTYGASEHSVYSADYLLKFAKNISSLADINEDNRHYEMARTYLKQSDFLLVMGFGFHQSILERLDLTAEKMSLNLQAYALSVGLEDSIIKMHPQFNFYKPEILCKDFSERLSKKLHENILRSEQRTKPPRPKNRPKSIREAFDPFATNDYNPFGENDNWVTRY